jgi:aspartyl-tRNA synthetase
MANKFIKKTKNCGDIRKEDTGKQVVINGWANTRRDHGGLIFIDLRDRSGICQIVIPPENVEAFNAAQKVRSEFCLAVKGTVKNRPAGTVNPKLPTGEIEIETEELIILSSCEPLPFELDEAEKVDERLRLKYRFLDLRRPEMANCIMLRHAALKVARSYLEDNGFIEIETPDLTKSTPEGARDFLVPSRLQPGHFYALPQSPQLFKQILMVCGFEKYYQIARAFRDEDLRADRQPEHTQIDIEMSFTDEDDIINLAEELIAAMFSVAGVAVKSPFRRMTYDEAILKYGCDKPDTRFEMLIEDVTDAFKDSEFNVFKKVIESGGAIRGINVKGQGAMTRSELEKLTEKAKDLGAGGLVWMIVEGKNRLKSPVAKFLSVPEIESLMDIFKTQQDDLLLIVADKKPLVYEVLAELRLYLGRKLELMKPGFEFLTVVDFPMFEYDAEEKRFKSHHHPFTRPRDESLRCLDTEPLNAKSYAYDMIINGVEVGGGSLRIYDIELQKKVFGLLGISNEEAQEKFGFLLEAFKFGPPPHGGIAFGLDRLAMLLSGRSTIRDVIAFPKTQSGSDLMTGAPDEVSKKQLKELNIKTDL